MEQDSVKFVEISKFENFCFCCLTEVAVLNDLLHRTIDFHTQLVECYTACSGIAPDLESPKKICSTCETKLKSSFTFREMCRASYQQLTEKPVSLPEIFVDVKYEVDSGDEVVEEVIQADSHAVAEVLIKSEHHTHATAERLKKVKKPINTINDQLDYPEVPDDTVASDLESEFVCFHCDITISTHREYKRHYETLHRPRSGKGYTRVAKFCEVCKKDTSSFVNHIRDNHPDYKVYKCKFCSKQYKASGELRRHLDSHATAQINYECMACHEKFSRDFILRKHILDHEKNNPAKKYFCPVCGYTSEQYQPLYEHIKASHEKSNAYPCFHCKKVFVLQKHYLDHKCRDKIRKTSVTATHTCHRCYSTFTSADELFCHKVTYCNQPDEYTCEVCEKSYATKIKMQIHYRQVHLRRVFKICEICGHSSKDNETYSLHMTTHQSESNFKCPRPGCQKAFKHEASLKNHMRRHEAKDNNKDKPYECHHCPKTFPFQKAIKLHLANHFEDLPELRPFMCTVCGDRKKTQSALDEHMVVHTGVKPIKCKVCPLMYPTESQARRHYKRSHSASHYLCKFCGVKVRCQKDFKVHLFKHRGFLPYQCPICPKTFGEKPNLRRHIREVHKTERDLKHYKYVEKEVDWVQAVLTECKVIVDESVIVIKPRKSRKRQRETDCEESDID